MRRPNLHPASVLHTVLGIQLSHLVGSGTSGKDFALIRDYVVVC